MEQRRGFPRDTNEGTTLRMTSYQVAVDAGLAYSKVGPVVGLKDHVVRRIYQTALTKLRHRDRLQRILAAVTPSWRVLRLVSFDPGDRRRAHGHDSSVEVRRLPSDTQSCSSVR